MGSAFCDAHCFCACRSPHPPRPLPATPGSTQTDLAKSSKSRPCSPKPSPCRERKVTSRPHAVSARAGRAPIPSLSPSVFSVKSTFQRFLFPTCNTKLPDPSNTPMIRKEMFLLRNLHVRFCCDCDCGAEKDAASPLAADSLAACGWRGSRGVLGWEPPGPRPAC